MHHSVRLISSLHSTVQLWPYMQTLSEYLVNYEPHGSYLNFGAQSGHQISSPFNTPRTPIQLICSTKFFCCCCWEMWRLFLVLLGLQTAAGLATSSRISTSCASSHYLRTTAFEGGSSVLFNQYSLDENICFCSPGPYYVDELYYCALLVPVRSLIRLNLIKKSKETLCENSFAPPLWPALLAHITFNRI